MKYILPVIFVALAHIPTFSNDSLTVRSPSGSITVKVWMDSSLNYSISWKENKLLENAAIDLQLINKPSFSANNRIRSHNVRKINNSILSPVPEKRKLIPDNYNELSIVFIQPYTVEFRVYDDGVAYRILTRFKDSLYVKNELARFAFSADHPVYYPAISKRDNADIFHTSFEELYAFKKLSAISDTAIAYNPVLIASETGPKIAITESDLDDYPGMFLKGSGRQELTGAFAGYPVEEVVNPGEFPQLMVTKRADYIAKTAGKRSFPWRILLISEKDRDLPSNDLVYRLAAPSKIKDPSWIRPGKGTDEWIIGINLFNVPFKAGLNTATYKYYIDFAQRYGLQRIMMDAGWSDNKDLLRIHPDINMDELASYAKQKGVKLSMWTLAMTLDRQLDSALAQFKKWGVDFVMTDFIDRDDQKAVRFYHRMAKAFADQQIMLMFHGAFAPKGLNRTYPNVVSTEGVLGSEYNIWSDKVSPSHDVTLAYTRMLAGPMDYEPGILINATRKQFRPIDQMVMSQGTRAHQLALFVVYDNPMPIFSGNPSQAEKEPEFMRLLGSIPSTWDETKIIDGKVAEFIVTARKKGNEWYIAGITDWTARQISLPLDFLEPGISYRLTICRDGVNAERYPADYELLQQQTIRSDEPLSVKMAPGGGFLIHLSK
jgi:alpha-glucosidase